MKVEELEMGFRSQPFFVVWCVCMEQDAEGKILFHELQYLK